MQLLLKQSPPHFLKHFFGLHARRFQVSCVSRRGFLLFIERNKCLAIKLTVPPFPLPPLSNTAENRPRALQAILNQFAFPVSHLLYVPSWASNRFCFARLVFFFCNVNISVHSLKRSKRQIHFHVNLYWWWWMVAGSALNHHLLLLWPFLAWKRFNFIDFGRSLFGCNLCILILPRCGPSLSWRIAARWLQRFSTGSGSC